MAEGIYIGVDLGGTRLRAARFGTDLHMQKRSETLTLAAETSEAIIQRIENQIDSVWPTDGVPVRGLGVSVPGMVNPKTGRIVYAANLRSWEDIALREILRGRYAAPVYLGNDANLAAVAEAEMGAARGYQDVIFLTISTGIGGGILVDGRLLVGAEGLGAEVGEMVLRADDGRISSLEREAAGLAIAAGARAAIERGERTLILDLVDGEATTITAATVGKAALAGDALALRLVERAGRLIGLGVVNLLHLFNPEILVIGGGVAEGMGNLLLDPLRETIQRHACHPGYWRKLVIVQAMLGEDVSLIGAAALARREGE